MVSKRHPVISSRWFHLVVLAVGTAYLLTGAFHGNLWFDESYSVGIARNSFAEIWRIGSGDVHPVLYYWALHVIHLLGGDLTAYRVFTVFGAVSMAAIGFTHLRRDFGWRTGLLFTVLAIWTPYVSFIAIEVRMYSWATCMVMLTFVYGFRIMRNKAARLRDGDDANAPASLWVKFALCSLAAAYLHYFALISVFIVNLGVLVYLLSRRKQHRRDLVAFAIQAVAQVGAYTPWLLVLASQIGVVSNTYWVIFHFPDTFISLARYPLITMQIDFAWNGDYGPFARVIVWVIIISAIFLAVSIISAVIGYVRRQHRSFRPSIKAAPWYKRIWHFIVKPDNLPGFLGLSVYFGLFAIAWVASIAMHSLMVYFRYMFCAIGPLIFSVVWLLRRIDKNRITVGVCALFISLSLLNQALIVKDDYSPDNQAPIDYLAENVHEGDLVISSDIGVEGVTALELPDMTQYYLNWQKGNWGLAYEAYSPTLISIPGWETVLNDYHGYFWVLGQSSNGSRPKDIDDLDAKDGISVVNSQVFFRPYERSYYTVTLMYRE
jgi:hypothetical protein